MSSEYGGKWRLDGDLGHDVWTEVKDRDYVYWPHNTDAFIELYLDPRFGDPLHLQRTAGVQNSDGEFVTFEPGEGFDDDTDKWFDKSGIGWASFDWQYKYANPGRGSSTIDQITFWGHVYSTAGTRFWFEVKETEMGGPLFVDRMRVPVPDTMVDDVKEWAAEKGCEHLHTKGAVFDQRFDVGDVDGDQPYHQDVHVRCEGVETVEHLKEILYGGLDFTEDAAKAENAPPA